MAGFKVLGQASPAATTMTDLYIAPPGPNGVVVGSLVATNTSATPTTIRVAVRVANLALTAKQYLAYDLPIGANQIIPLPVPICLAATDVISVYNALATVTFQAFGQEL